MSPNRIDIIVRELPSDVSTLCAGLSAEERDYASQLSERRQREWVAWRALLHERAEHWGVGERALRVAYAATGEPLFEGFTGSISVSHSRRYVALGYVAEGRCGVDIEQLDRNYQNIETKYISDSEAAMSEASDERFRAVVWCSKEATYKCLRREGVDFRRDMRVASVDFESGRVCVEAFGERFEGVIRWLEGAVLVAVVASES